MSLYLMECNQIVVVVCCICVCMYIYICEQVVLIWFHWLYLIWNVIKFFVCCISVHVWAWFDFSDIFSGVLVSNPSSFPHSVFWYEVLSTAASVYGDVDCELKFGIGQNVV